MQELIWKHPERFFNEPLKQIAWEASSGVGRADLVFEDRHGRLLIIEVKKGKLPRGAIDQLHDYFGMMKQKYPNKAVEMMVVAWAIPQERRLACEHYDIECKEFSERWFREIAAEHGYVFASESQISEKTSEGSASLSGIELTVRATETIHEVSIRDDGLARNGPQMSEKSKQDAQVVPESRMPLLPVLRAFVLRTFADGMEHTSEEIRERVRVQFEIAPHELLRKHNDRTSVFHNKVALALANLQGAPHRGSKCIEQVGERGYKITEHGKTILKRNPSTLTIKDL